VQPKSTPPEVLATTRHVPSGHQPVGHREAEQLRFWDQLSPEERKLIQDSVSGTRDYQREVTIKADNDALSELRVKGMQFNEIATAEMARIRAATKPVVAKFSADFDQAKVKLFNAELERIQKA
jgi:TRAP-type transport system periplasmic protein